MSSYWLRKDHLVSAISKHMNRMTLEAQAGSTDYKDFETNTEILKLKS